MTTGREVAAEKYSFNRDNVKVFVSRNSEWNKDQNLR